MRGKSTKIKDKIVSSMCIAILLVLTFGVISASAYEVSIGDSNLDYYFEGYNVCYATNYVSIDGSASVYSQPTYGTVNKSGKHMLGLGKKRFWGSSNVLSKVLPLYESNSGKSYSYMIGTASGKNLCFLVSSYDGSDGATFYLTAFYGMMRN